MDVCNMFRVNYCMIRWRECCGKGNTKAERERERRHVDKENPMTKLVRLLRLIYIYIYIGKKYSMDARKGNLHFLVKILTPIIN